MKHYPYLLTAVLFIFTACSNKKETTPVTSKGPWDGTYKMTSTQTIFSDTTEYPGGSKIITTAETITGSNFAGTLSVTKENMQLSGFSYTLTTMVKKRNIPLPQVKPPYSHTPALLIM